MFQRTVYRIHLWAGIALGLYVLVMSISGSAIVARRELIPMLVPQSVPVAGERLSGSPLKQKVREVYADYEVLEVYENLRPVRAPRSGYGRGEVDSSLARPYQVTLERNGVTSTRLFNPFTGVDLGDEQPWTLKTLLWTTELHADLLAGEVGRTVNGCCGVMFVVLVATGLIVWSTKGRRYLSVRRNTGWYRQTMQLHGVFGFWPFALLALWAVSGVYLAFPTGFSILLESLFPVADGEFNERVDAITAWLSTMHFGRFGGMGVRWTWIVLGLVPAVLFISGFVLWWNSVVKPWHRRVRQSASLPAESF